MKTRKKLRVISFVMLAVAVVFVFCALSCPTLGRTVWIGSFEFGAKQWRVCYRFYVIVMMQLLVLSFFAKDRK